MNKTKSIFKSGTLYSLLGVFLPMIGSWIGYDFTAVINDHDISVNQIIEVVSLFIAAYNRYKADHKLVLAKPATPNED